MNNCLSKEGLLCDRIPVMNIEEAKAAVAAAMRRTYERGLTTTTGGNISARSGSVMVITPSGLDKDRLNPGDIALVDIETGSNLTPEKKLSIETEMHRMIYLKRDDVMAVCHSHPTFSCLFSASEEEIDTSLIAETCFLLDRVRKVEYARMGTVLLAEKVSDAVAEGANAVLLENHGALAVGKSLINAFDRLECLEQAAKLTLMSHIVKTKGLTDEEKKELALMR